MGCGSSMSASGGTQTVVIFGATGLLGESVARALLQDPFKFKVRCVTRRSSSEKAKELAELGAVIVSGDLDEPKSLEKALENANVMFLTTHYWEENNRQKEIVRGLNAVDAAIHCGVSHIVFNGSENVKKVVGKDCNHLDSKNSIEEYIREVEPDRVMGRQGFEPEAQVKDNVLAGDGSSVNFTIIRLPFWYENFYTIFKPHKVKHGVYALPLPLEDGVLDAMSVNDVGDIIFKILCRPKSYFGKTLGLSCEKLTMDQMVDVFNKHIDNRKFKDPKIRVKDYEKFTFNGAQDLAAMFEFYIKGGAIRDTKLTKKLNPQVKNLDKWLEENKEKIEEILKDKENSEE